ncbi:unnamed protein product [Protopolystoma xenopodis]|uniref:Uncharacterized protein n=1 Tax=Protopolystoma xenopodis TaxID=117903 RepID=A0A448XL55_9PLAT|nr:unnamed protein product [Protopolystoma xenopodis]
MEMSMSRRLEAQLLASTRRADETVQAVWASRFEGEDMKTVIFSRRDGDICPAGIGAGTGFIPFEKPPESPRDTASSMSSSHNPTLTNRPDFRLLARRQQPKIWAGRAAVYTKSPQHFVSLFGAASHDRTRVSASAATAAAALSTAPPIHVQLKRVFVAQPELKRDNASPGLVKKAAELIDAAAAATIRDDKRR